MAEEQSPREALLAVAGELARLSASGPGRLVEHRLARAVEVLASMVCPHGCRPERWCPAESQTEAAKALAILRGSHD